MLIEGPVEIVLPDGATRMCERPVIALCTCRRSLRMPFCDTSHRRRNRGAARFPSRAATTAQAGAEGAKQAEEA
ncbi:CDGSH iron-sulfur domain-containing protein [Streptomyces sp. NPDC048629]|uniref:CDGSH iron-sulfur domain-containing protein n=1 Tax=Streptomyces solicathayae TaxID=3081768 RepID=A0ABZ0M412_9ACTN|nr:CDGSH iron-sulfur domain-containing protein [Streptomyces sp. HUAS YS2]WOX26528.1 CDGSH iron-sulfur domain-containing protein [Streptomyces sp. HUAS YS2]